MFKLRGQLYGHRGDVRALACFDSQQAASLCGNSDLSGAESIFSGSRDKTACIWSLNGPEGKVIHTLRAHTEFVNAVCVVPNATEGLLVLTASGKVIRAFAPLDAHDPESPRYVLEGHEKEVCFLSTTGNRGSDSLLLSGSWDHTARVWDLRRRCTLLKLTGHDKSVWVVRQVSLGEGGGLVLTGSADCSIKGWRAGRCVFTLVGHTDCVRDLLAVEGAALLVSASNDATLRIWRIGLEERECACVRVLPGHESYIYSLALVSLSSAVLELASVGEDRALKLWAVALDEVHTAASLPGGAPFEDYRACLQTLVHPAISVWCVAALPNGDLVTGASDGVIRLFTRNPSRMAPADVQKAFEESVQKSAVPAQALGENVDVKKLSGVEALCSDGSKEGEYRMVRDEKGKGQLYTWSMAEQRWQLVGEIVGQKDEQKQRGPLLDRDGRTYECVYDVSFDMPELAGTRIGWHPGENPYEVAQRFIYAHDIPQDNLDVIAQFIIRNTPEGMAPTSGTGAPLVTGFTIPDRYIPGSAGGGGSGGDGGGAHFSTGFDLPDRYVPPSFSTPAPSSQIASSNFFPQQELVFFAAGSPDAVLRKFAEFNGQVDATARLSEAALHGLVALHAEGAASAQSVAAALHALEWVMAEWPLANLFPALDLLRLSLMGPRARTVSDWLFQSSEVVQQAPIDRMCSRALLDASHSSTTQAMAIRVLCNAFASDAGIAYIVRSRDLLSSFLAMLIDSHPERLLESRHLALATVTALLDMAVLLARSGSASASASASTGASGLQSVSGEERMRLQYGLLEACGKLGNVQPAGASAATSLDPESALRLLVAVGTLASALLRAQPARRGQLASVVQLDRLARVTGSRTPNAPDNLRICFQDIERLFA